MLPQKAMSSVQPSPDNVSDGLKEKSWLMEPRGVPLAPCFFLPVWGQGAFQDKETGKADPFFL